MNLNQITIPSHDLVQSVLFYKKLGLTLIVDSIPRYARFVCPDGNSSFSIHHVDELPIGAGIIIYFECEELDDQVKSLMDQGIQFEQLPIDQDWLWKEARLKDPDGNQLILFYGGKNRLDPPWKV